MRIEYHGDMSSHGRFLCLSDFSPGNFRKLTTADGRLVAVALDFGAACFMPHPFIEVALREHRDPFSQTVSAMITFPLCEFNDAELLLAASGALVQYGAKPVGKHDISILFPSAD